MFSKIWAMNNQTSRELCRQLLIKKMQLLLFKNYIFQLFQLVKVMLQKKLPKYSIFIQDYLNYVASTIGPMH